MSNEMYIKQLRSMEDEPGTQDALSDLLIRVVEEGASVGFLPPLSRAEANTYWQQASTPGVNLWVAFHDNKIVGTVQLQLADKSNASHRAEVAKLLVHPNHRRQGIARRLMQTAEQAARNAGRSTLILDTRSGDPSNALYRSMGYSEAGRIPNYARSADGNLDETTFYYKLM